MLPRDTYAQPEAADAVLDTKTVLDLARRHVPTASTVTLVDESGGEARAYFIDEQVVFKVQRPHRLRSRTSLEKEVFFLKQLAAYPEISVPRVLGYGSEGGVEYICMTRMHGVPAGAVQLEGAQREQVLQDLGRTLRGVHGIAQAPFFDSPLFPGFRSSEEFMRRMRTGFDEAVNAVASSPALWPFAVEPAALGAAALARIPASVGLVALHSNPGPEHTYVDPNTRVFTGLIDFGDAYISHPALDCRWAAHDDRLAILQGYCGNGESIEEFMAVWRSVRILGDMAALANRPERRAQAVESLGHLIAGLG